MKKVSEVYNSTYHYKGNDMNVNFESLQQIPKLVALMEELIKLQKEGTIEKKWMNVEETAFYLGYSKDKVYKLIQEEWVEGVHYHKPTGRVIVEKEKIDLWVKNGMHKNIKHIIKKICSDTHK